MCRMASIPPRERRLRRKICGEINGCYWEAFNRCSNSIIHVFLLLSIYGGTPLIDNLVSCPLILKDVRLYNKVKSRMFHFFFSMSKRPWECAFICNSVYEAQRVDDTNSSGRVGAPHERKSCFHVTAQILRQTISPCNPAQRATKSTCAHTPVGAAYSSPLIMFSSCFTSNVVFFLSSTFLSRSPGVFQPAAVQHRWRLLSCHVHLQ